MGSMMIRSCIAVLAFTLATFPAFAQAQTCAVADGDLCYDEVPAGSSTVSIRAALDGFTAATYGGTVKAACERGYLRQINCLTETYVPTSATEPCSATSTIASSRRTSIIVEYRAVVAAALATMAANLASSMTAAQFQAAIAAAATSLGYTGTLPIVGSVSFVVSESSSNKALFIGVTVGASVCLMAGAIAFVYACRPKPAAASVTGGSSDPAVGVQQ